MTIACLGWGSLVWEPRGLPIKDGWNTDGPTVRVEFLRQSKDRRITLVLEATAKPVPALWSKMNSLSLEAARAALKDREETADRFIGSWSSSDTSPFTIPTLADWAADKGITGVVWTALPPKFKDIERSASADEIVTYLSGLNASERDRAENYVRRAPRQIATNYREIIEQSLGWLPHD